MDDKFSLDVRYDDDGEYESTPGSSANGKIPTLFCLAKSFNINQNYVD